jgi:hypothetical protein
MCIYAFQRKRVVDALSVKNNTAKGSSNKKFRKGKEAIDKWRESEILMLI